MGSVTIKLASSFHLKENTFSWDIGDRTSLAELLSGWGAANEPELLGKLFNPETGFIAEMVLVLQNGRSVKSVDPKSTTVSPGDSIYITPILPGG